MRQYETGLLDAKLLLSLLCWVCGAFAAFAQDPVRPEPAPAAVQHSTIEPFGDRYSQLSPAPRQQARVLVYRTGPRALSDPVNIYLNGRYHVSLLQGGFSEFCAAAGTAAFHAVLADASKMHTGKQGPSQPWTFQAGQSLFLKVQESGRLAEVDRDQVQRDLALNAQQVHTVSRSPLVQVCQQPAPVLAQVSVVVPVPPPVPPTVPPPVPPPVWGPKPLPLKPSEPRLYALESDALFEFGKSELRVSSYNAIEIMAQSLKRDFSGVERVRVIGHTDAIGQAKSNAKLSMARAKVVAKQLQDRGLKPSKGFTVEGEGATQLVKLRCGNKPTPENKQCHAPNRRVEIVVTGARR